MPIDWKAMPIAAGFLVIVLNDDVDVTDEEWAGYVQSLREGAARDQGRFDRVFGLVVSDGGTTSQAQRALLGRVLEGQALRVGVLSDSLRVRRDAQAAGWVYREVKYFSSDEAGAWIEHVPLTKAERAVVRREILMLQKTIRTRTVARIEPWLTA
jgi:hypothetical protein